jgi:hypothetical protein
MLFLDEFRMTSPQVEQLIQTRITEVSNIKKSNS